MQNVIPITKRMHAGARIGDDVRRYARAPKPIFAMLQAELDTLRDLLKETKIKPTFFR